MRLLLDENLPKRLKLDFPTHEVFTVRDMGWHGTKNGELLKLMITNDFQALLTFDKNLQHQQNVEKYTVSVFVLNAKVNTYAVLTTLSEKINSILANNDLDVGSVIIIKG